MTHCYGTTGFVQADCGSAKPHDEHDFTEKICLGSPAAFIEADCGRVGPHGEHPMTAVPR